MLKTVVIIDDSEEDRYLVGRAIKRAQLEVSIVEYETAFSAIDDFADPQRFEATFGPAPPPILVFLDINMPRMSGFDFLERLHQYEFLSSRCAIVTMLTSSNNPQETQRADEFDMVTQYTVKPITAEQIATIAQSSDFKVA